MDVLEKFLYNTAYKFPKGYPDLKDNQDFKILTEEFNKIGINLHEIFSPEAQTAIEILKKEFDFKDEDFKKTTSTNFKVLMDGGERSEFLKKASQLDNFDFELKGSSVGRLKYQPPNSPRPVLIYPKPKSQQGLGSAGKQNEKDFNDLINNKVEENEGPITVILKSSNQTFKFPNVIKAIDASMESTTDFAKADTQFLDPNGKVLANISLKKQNAIRWESSKTRPIGGVNVFKSFIEKVGKIGTEDEVGKFENVVLYPLDRKNKYKLYNPITNQVLSKVVIKNTPEDVLEKVVFGKDTPKTIVVKETFEGGYDNYTFENGVLTLNCHIIYGDISDIKDTEDEPVFAFSNHIGQAYGIEFRSFSKKALYNNNDLKGSSVEINFNDLK